MKSMLRLSVWLVPVLLMGCSTLSSTSFISYKDKKYLKARSIAPIRIPVGISSTAFHNEYPVSDRQYPPAVEDINLEPPGLDMKS